LKYENPMKRTSFSSLVALAASLLFTTHAFAQDDPAPPDAPTDPAAAPGDQPATGETPPPDEKKNDEETKPEEQQPPPPTTAPTEPPTTPPPAEPPPAAAPPPVTFGATTAPQADTGKKPGDQGAGEAKPEKLKWRNTTFAWDNSATTETVGLGQDIQSRNPTYEMSFNLRPRYYLYDDDDQSLSARADIGTFRELTNSDTTTKRGEWSFTDAQLWGAYTRYLVKDGDYATYLNFKAPVLTFPTSKVSANVGRYLQLGATAGIAQDVPLMGSKSDVFQSLSLAFSAGYAHWFTRATTPTNNELDYVRMDPGGRSLPGDQLSSSAFAQHQATFTFGADLAIHDRVTWSNALSWRPSWKYTFDENVQVCNNVTTGCATPDRVNDPQHVSVVTLFNTEFDVKVIEELELAIGYANLTLQLGPDGNRRNVFYSPDARVYFTATAYIDKIYQATQGSVKARATTGAETATAGGNQSTY
jgi:hypothetical protein